LLTGASGLGHADAEATIPSSPDSRSAANRLEIRVELEVAKGIVF